MSIPNGPYHYYLPNRLDKPPRLCQVVGHYAYFVDDGDPVRLDKLTGTFIMLMETGLPLHRQPQAGAQNPPGG